uniref:Uncharacterized protein n=1 Tax=Anguilla anguilla TaxID=7936 RepID=A0A0E9P7Q4_ANGAN
MLNSFTENIIFITTSCCEYEVDFFHGS